MRLLIIEDSEEIINCIKIELEKIGICVDTATSGFEGEEKAYVNEYDIIILDIGLPDKNGIEILKYLRKESIDTPVMILTGCDERKMLIQGLEIGADDYLIKPIQMEEIVARVRAIIRRYNKKSNPDIKIGNLVVNTSTRIALYNNKKLELTIKEFDILEYLAMKFPAVISSEEILEHVYNEYFNPFSSVLRVHITKLRKKLEKASGKEILITTRGKGYSLTN